VNYDKVRWDYPEELYKDVLMSVKPGEKINAIEIGAGTGKATKPFLEDMIDNRPVPISKMFYDDFLKPAEIYRGFRFESLEQYGFEDVTMKLYNASRTYDADEYITLLETYSDHRALPDNSRASLYAGIKAAIIKHGGYQKLNFIYQLYMGKKDKCILRNQ